MIASPPLYPYHHHHHHHRHHHRHHDHHHHHASGWPPRFYESQVSNTKIQVHFARTCRCQRLRHSCRGKRNHPRAPFITRAMSWFGLVWVIEFALPRQILSEPHSSIKFDDFCDNRVTIVDQRVTDPSGSEKQADQPTHVWHHVSSMSVGNQTKRWLIVGSIWCKNINLPWEHKSSLENDAVKETIHQWFGISLTWTTSLSPKDQTRQEHRNSEHFTSESTSKHRRSVLTAKSRIQHDPTLQWARWKTPGGFLEFSLNKLLTPWSHNPPSPQQTIHPPSAASHLPKESKPLNVSRMHPRRHGPCEVP